MSNVKFLYIMFRQTEPNFSQDTIMIFIVVHLMQKKNAMIEYVIPVALIWWLWISWRNKFPLLCCVIATTLLTQFSSLCLFGNRNRFILYSRKWTVCFSKIISCQAYELSCSWYVAMQTYFVVHLFCCIVLLLPWLWNSLLLLFYHFCITL